jgi:ectoine hydroxylase-related dioxygenase (phytanoyl-CoA dioxygenase family)
MSIYQRDGFIHLKGFYKADEVAIIRAHVDEIQLRPEVHGEQMMWFEDVNGERVLHRVEDFCRRHDGMAEHFVKKDDKMLKMLTDLVDEELVLFKDKINFKLPGGVGFKAHQDQAAGWDKLITWSVSVAVFVDEATIENGCLEVASGHHKNGLLKEMWEPIDDLNLPYEYVTCDPGDVIVFDSYVPHRSGVNGTSKPRRAIFLT